MGARQAVLLTPPKPPYPRPLPFRQHPASLTPLNATLTESPLTAANKRLTPKLTRLDATLTKNKGMGPTPLGYSTFSPVAVQTTPGTPVDPGLPIQERYITNLQPHPIH